MKNSKKFVLTTGGFPWCGGRRSTAGCEWCSLTCCSRGSGSILCFKIRSFGQKFWKYLGANRITISCVLFFFSRKRKCRASCDPTLAEGEAFFSNKMKLTIDHQHHCLAGGQATWAWCQMKKHRWGIDHSLQACLTDKKTNKQQKQAARHSLVRLQSNRLSLHCVWCSVQAAERCCCWSIAWRRREKRRLGLADNHHHQRHAPLWRHAYGCQRPERWFKGDDWSFTSTVSLTEG